MKNEWIPQLFQISSLRAGELRLVAGDYLFRGCRIEIPGTTLVRHNNNKCLNSISVSELVRDQHTEALGNDHVIHTKAWRNSYSINDTN